MSDVIIFVRGGVFQGAVSNSENNRIMVVDYDDEAEASRVRRIFEQIPVEHHIFQQTLNATEGMQSTG